eukprot:197028_1
MYVTNGFGGYLAAVAVCIGMSLFSIYDFRDIFRLKEQIETTKQYNTQFKIENMKMQGAVNTIESVNQKLKDITERFTEDNKKLSENIKSLSTFVSEFETTNKGMEGQQSALMKRCKDWIHDWRKEAAYNVSRVLKMAYKAVDEKGMDDKKGLSATEYVIFLESLPDDYKWKITSRYKDFDSIDRKISQDLGQSPDGNIDMQEFRQLMDEVCAVGDD